MATIQMKLSQGIGLGWYFSNNSSGSKFLRFELVKFLNAGISELAARNVEAKFSSLNPLRRFLFHKYDKLASLLRDTLNVVTILEEKISVMESSPAIENVPKQELIQPGCQLGIFRGKRLTLSINPHGAGRFPVGVNCDGKLKRLTG